ncbi:MAG: hypothetical protein LBI45_06405 [Bacteroidales bacterium]|jgi:hypothetical protein|nr:hypothetical protein [Bacteroidales bacterium]
MQKYFFYFIAPLLVVFFNSCKPEECKEKGRKNITGAWKLLEVSIKNNNQNIVTLDYNNDIIIYNFHSNNKLVISGMVDSLQIFDDFKEGEHFYEYRRQNVCHPDEDPGPNLNIDSQAGLVGHYFCTALSDNQTMYISGTINVGGVISENGAIIGGNNYHLNQTLIIYK